MGDYDSLKLYYVSAFNPFVVVVWYLYTSQNSIKSIFAPKKITFNSCV